jgi:outer membrane receptor protein involved in Fe transport
VAEVDVGFSEIIDEVNFGFATTFEAQWGERWRFVADLNYINLSDDNGTPGPLFDGAQVTAKTFIFDPEIGYSIAGNDTTSLDAMVGIRYWHLENRLELRRGADRLTVVGTSNWVDLVGGLRVKAALSPMLYLTAKADVGGLGSDLTYQLFGGLGINFSPRFTTIIGYRYLDVNYRGGNTVFDVALGGLIMGFGIRF